MYLDLKSWFVFNNTKFIKNILTAIGHLLQHDSTKALGFVTRVFVTGAVLAAAAAQICSTTEQNKHVICWKKRTPMKALLKDYLIPSVRLSLHIFPRSAEEEQMVQNRLGSVWNKQTKKNYRFMFCIFVPVSEPYEYSPNILEATQFLGDVSLGYLHFRTELCNELLTP